MLTNDQLEVIDKIPNEGALSYDFQGQTLTFTQPFVDAAVESAFAGKKPPADKRAGITLGAPGVGKTTMARALYGAMPEVEKEGTIFVAYNEGGAEDFCAPFQQEMARAASVDERIAVAKNTSR